MKKINMKQTLSLSELHNASPGELNDGKLFCQRKILAFNQNGREEAFTIALAHIETEIERRRSENRATFLANNMKIDPLKIADSLIEEELIQKTLANIKSALDLEFNLLMRRKMVGTGITFSMLTDINRGSHDTLIRQNTGKTTKEIADLIYNKHINGAAR